MFSTETLMLSLVLFLNMMAAKKKLLHNLGTTVLVAFLREITNWNNYQCDMKQK